MNPDYRIKIDHFKEILERIEKIGKINYLRDLEDMMINEIVYLINDGTESARIDLKKLEGIISKENLGRDPRNSFLISALKNSLSGALSVAKLCLF